LSLPPLKLPYFIGGFCIELYPAFTSSIHEFADKRQQKQTIMIRSTLVERIRNRVAAFRTAGSGNVVIPFALLLIPLVGAVGAAVDFSLANKARTELEAAADAAAVGSVRKSSPAMAAAATMSADGPIVEGAADAVDIFNAQLGGRTGFNNALASAAVARSNGSVTSTVTFTASVPTKFMGLFGKTALAITGISKAANGLPTYIDFYLLLDNTPSMGVGATPADVATMVNNTPDQCAFACHDLSDPNNYYNKAKLLGVTTRIDVVRSATQQLMDTAQATAVTAGQFRTGIYHFGSSASLGLTTVAPLMSNLTSAKTLAAAVDLMTVPYQNYNHDMDTDFNGVLTDMNAAISNPGNGSSASSPQKVLFFVSDGVNDSHIPASSCSQPLAPGGRCQAPIDVSYCTTIKNRGIKIAVLYTTYLPLPTNAWYNSWIAPFASQIGTNMQNCASPDLYFEVTPTQGISDAMNALFKKVVSQAHLIQ